MDAASPQRIQAACFLIPAATVSPVGQPLPLTRPGDIQVEFYNDGLVTAFISYSNTSAADAHAKAVIPTTGAANNQQVFPVAAGCYITKTFEPGTWFSGITASSTANVYCTPGEGN